MRHDDQQGPAGAPPRAPKGPGRLGRAARAATRGVGRAGRGVSRGSRASARVMGKGAGFTTAKYRSFAAKDGAGESGLARLTELHTVAMAGDAAVTVSLAGTVFAMPVDQARGQVALFLLLTMAPFVVLAPFIGPLLDRYRHGRRWALGTTVAVRAFLAWVLASAVVEDSPWLFPAALGCLVASRTYAVGRAAAVPRLLPRGTTLVTANSRLNVAGLIGMGVGGGLAGALSRVGPDWSLRLAFAIFVAATIMAILLPPGVDSDRHEPLTNEFVPEPHPASPGGPGGPAKRPSPPRGERWDERRDDDTTPHTGWAATTVLRPPEAGSDPLRTRVTEPLPVGDTEPIHQPIHAPTSRPGNPGKRRRRMEPLPRWVRFALWFCSGARLLSGFLTLFLAFLMRVEPLPGWEGPVVLAMVVGAAGTGNALASVLGNLKRMPAPQVITSVTAGVTIVAGLATALFYGLPTLLVLGFVCGLFAQLGKVSLDALVQTEVAEEKRGRVFSWTETILQGFWVLGGAIGILLPLDAVLGFAVITALVVAATLVGLYAARLLPGARPAAR